MGMLRRLSGTLGHDAGHDEPLLRRARSPHRHHHPHRHSAHVHRSSHRKNYSVPVLGGNRPIVIPADADSPVTRPGDSSREKRASRSRSSSTSSSSHHSSHSKVSSGSSLKKSSDIVVEYSDDDDDDDDDRRSSRSRRSSASPHVPERANTIGGTAADHASKRSAAPSSSGTAHMGEPASKASPLEQARRRNTFAGASMYPPYPLTPPVAAKHADTTDYIAYHPARSSMDQIHPALRPGAAPARSRASSNAAVVGEPAASQPTIVEIGSSDSAHVKPRRADSGKSFGSTSGAGPRPKREDPYDFLREFDTVFVVDDSASMDGGDLSRWNETREALETVAAVATRYDADGIDIKFLNNREHDTYNITSASAIRGLFQRVRPAGCTPTGRCLDSILREYIDRYAASKKAAEPSASPTPDAPRPAPVKPLNIVVLTDGEPTDDPESVIVDTARTLERLNAPLHQVGIQFVQIGDEPGAREALEELDDALAGVYHIRDMVDTTPYNGIRLTGETVLKVLLGGINRRIDRRKNVRPESDA